MPYEPCTRVERFFRLNSPRASRLLYCRVIASVSIPATGSSSSADTVGRLDPNRLLAPTPLLLRHPPCPLRSSNTPASDGAGLRNLCTPVPRVRFRFGRPGNAFVAERLRRLCP